MDANEGYETWQRSLEDSRRWGMPWHRGHSGECMETADAICSLSSTLWIPHITGTRTHLSTDCCFSVVGQQDCSRNVDCQNCLPSQVIMLCCSFELKKHCIKISSFMSSLLYLNIYSRADWFREEEHLLIPSLSVFMSSMQTLACTDCPFSKVLVLLLHCTIMDNNKCATLLLSPIIRMAKLRATSLLSQETLPLPLPLLPLQPVTSPVGRTLWNTLLLQICPAINLLFAWLPLVVAHSSICNHMPSSLNGNSKGLAVTWVLLISNI